MMVRYWMTSAPVTISKNFTLLQLLDYTHKYHARRFPVVDNGKLCGIVSVSDLYRIISPRATRSHTLPQKYRDKLSKHQVSKIMIPEPVTCDPNDHLEDIAKVMRSRKIGALPVVKDGALVGIITESDVLEALIEIAAGDSESKRITLNVPSKNKKREFYKLVKLCEKQDVEIVSLLSHPCGDNSLDLITLRIAGRNVDQVVESLWNSDHQILRVE